MLEFNELLRKSAEKLGVHYEPVESLDSQLRIVQFYDTKAEDLRKNKLIFRIRQIRQGGWPDDSWELTFKCRAPEYEKAAAFDTNTTMTKLQKKKFKEELIRGEAPGTMVSIYSNNVIVEYPEIEPEVPLSRLGERVCRTSRRSDIDLDETMAIVAGAKVFEIQSTLGTLIVRTRCHRACDARALGAAGARPFRTTGRGVWLFDPRLRERRKRREGSTSGRRFFQSAANTAARLPRLGDDEDRAHLRRRCGLGVRSARG